MDNMMPGCVGGLDPANIPDWLKALSKQYLVNDINSLAALGKIMFKIFMGQDITAVEAMVIFHATAQERKAGYDEANHQHSLWMKQQREAGNAKK